MLGHSDWVRALAITPDQQVVVSASDDHTVRIWDFKTGVPRYAAIGHTQPVQCVALSHDGRHVLSGSNDHQIISWDVSTGQEESRVAAGEAVLALALTSDGGGVAGLWNHTIMGFNRETRDRRFLLTGHTGPVSALALTSDGRHVVSGSDDRTVKVWDLSRMAARDVPQHTDWVQKVVISSDRKRVVSASIDGTAKVWNFHTYQEQTTLMGHTQGVFVLDISPDARFAVTASTDYTTRVWDITDGSERFWMVDEEMHGSSWWSLTVSPDGRCAVLNDGNSDEVLVWNLESGSQACRLPARSVKRVAFTPDGQELVTGGRDGTIQIWDVDTWTERDSFTGQGGSVWGLMFSPDARRLITSSEDVALRVWRMDSGEVEWTWRGHKGHVNAVAVTPDGALVVSGGRDGSIKVWDLVSDSQGRTLLGHGDSVTEIATTADGRYVVSGSLDNSIKLWSLAEDKCLATFTFESRPCALAVADNGLIVVGEAAGRVHFIKAEAVEFGRPIVTVWRSSEGGLTYGCPQCRRWAETLQEQLGTQVKCPSCGAAALLNSFTAMGDWKRVMPAWKSCPIGRELSMPRPTIPILEVGLTIDGRYKEFSNSVSVPIPAQRRRAGPRGPEGGLVSTAHPKADPERAMRLNLEHIKAMKRWNALPWWRRIRTQKPMRPTGI